jgi:hypothetical protein
LRGDGGREKRAKSDSRWCFVVGAGIAVGVVKGHTQDSQRTNNTCTASQLNNDLQSFH